MLKLSIVLTILLVAGINSDKYDAFRSKHSENQFSSGKPRHHKDEKIEESASFKPVLQANGPPLPSPCTGFRAKTKIPHPFEKSKYIQCRDEFHYDVFACPTGTQYNPEFGACRTFVHIKDRCEEEKPCLNDGVCSIVSNTTLKCVCGPDWTGDRCEIPVNSCVMKPCGPTGECRTLKTTDSEQDYICLCQNRKEYGYNCQDVVPSPCISGEEVFFPFAFSNRAYIQCDGELIYFQSCGSLLYWNQEEKYCDRKRSHTVDASAISTKPAPMTDEESGPSYMVNDDSEELTTLAPTKSTKMITKVQEPIRQPMQRPRIDSEPTINFVPNQNINRRPIAVEGPAPVNTFQEQRFQDNQFIARPKFESPLPETTTRNIPIEPTNEEMPVRPWQNPSRPDRLRPETQFRFPTTTTAAPIADSNVAQSFMRGESFSQPQQPPRFNPSQQRFPERTNEERVPAVTNEERFPPVFSNRFRAEPSFAPTFPTRTTTFAPMIRENSFPSSPMSRGNIVAQPGFISDQQRFSERTGEERFPERTNEERFPERTNEERVPPVFSNRFRAEPSFAPTFPTRTTTLAPMIRENSFPSSSMGRGNAAAQPGFISDQQRFSERTSEERVPAVTNEERFPPVFSNRFRAEPSFAPTFPTRTTTLEPMIRENSFPSSSMGRGNAAAQPGFISDQQRFSERTSEERVPAVTNEERFPPVFSNRFRAEPSFAPTFPTRTTTLAPMIRENSFSSSSMGGSNAVTQPGFFPDQERFPERINEERVPQVFSNRFRAEPSFAPTFTTTTITTTMEPMIKETVTDSAPVQEESFQPWFHKFNLQSSTQPTLKGALIEPTTLAANIIRGPNFPAVTDEEEEFAHESTTTTTPPSFHTRAWPKNGFVTPSWQQRQRQPLPTADASLVPSQGVRRNEPVPMENGETWSTSTETMPFHQQRSSNMNNMDTNNLPSGEFQSFNTRRGMTNQNQARQQEQNMPSQSVHWKPRF